jgi:hypothetical protein
LRYVFGDYALDPRQSNPHGGSAVAKTLAGDIGLRSATRSGLGACSGLRTFDRFERSRVERLRDYALTVAYRRERGQDMLGGKDRIERRDAAFGDHR